MVNRNREFFRKNPFLMVLLLVVFMGIFAQDPSVLAQDGIISKRFLKIIPGVSARDDVETLFPVTKSREFNNEYIIDFNDQELAIGIVYSTGKCGDSLMYDWKFPVWTVVGVSYEWPGDERIPLRDVILDLSRFEKKQISDVTVHVNYINEEWGIDVVYDTKLKSVAGIDLEPTGKFKEKYGCP